MFSKESLGVAILVVGVFVAVKMLDNKVLHLGLL
jgi:hypothetical protein